jgi:hypothetical protein
LRGATNDAAQRAHRSRKNASIIERIDTERSNAQAQWARQVEKRPRTEPAPTAARSSQAMQPSRRKTRNKTASIRPAGNRRALVRAWEQSRRPRTNTRSVSCPRAPGPGPGNTHRIPAGFRNMRRLDRKRRRPIIPGGTGARPWLRRGTSHSEPRAPAPTQPSSSAATRAAGRRSRTPTTIGNRRGPALRPARQGFSRLFP